MKSYVQDISVPFIVLVLMLVYTSEVKGQVFLYLEDMTQVKAIKIPEGSKISIKTTYEKTWVSYKTDRLLPDDDILLHSQGMIHLDEITHLRIERKWVSALAYSMQSFGLAWGLYGVIILAADGGNTTWPIVIIGTIVPWTAGYIMKKIWQYKVYKIGRKNRLKILDLSFPDDPYSVKEKK